MQDFGNRNIFDWFFNYMVRLEIGKIAIHQMYRKCVEEIGDSRQ